MLIVKVGAVVAGFAAGAWVGTVLTPWIANRKWRSLISLGCGVVCGLAMWLAVTRSGGGGGWGFGGPGLGGSGSGSGSSTAPAATGSSRRQETARSDRWRVRMLGGERVRDQRFYVIDQGSPKTWAELVESLANREKEEPPLKSIEIVIYPDSVDRDNPAVQDLVNWAKEHRLQVTLSFPPQEGP
jgi:hypothetical protein